MQRHSASDRSVGYLLLSMARSVGHHHVRRAFSRQSQRNCLINSWRASRPWCTAGARGQNGACLPPYTRSRDPKIGPTSIYQTVSLGSSVNKTPPAFQLGASPPENKGLIDFAPNPRYVSIATKSAEK